MSQIQSKKQDDLIDHLKELISQHSVSYILLENLSGLENLLLKIEKKDTGLLFKFEIRIPFSNMQSDEHSYYSLVTCFEPPIPLLIEDLLKFINAISLLGKLFRVPLGNATAQILTSLAFYLIVSAEDLAKKSGWKILSNEN